MQTMEELLAKKKQLASILRTLDREADFQSEEGRSYCNLLVNATVVQLQIDELQKEKAAQ